MLFSCLLFFDKTFGICEYSAQTYNKKTSFRTPLRTFLKNKNYNILLNNKIKIFYYELFLENYELLTFFLLVFGLLTLIFGLLGNLK